MDIHISQVNQQDVSVLIVDLSIRYGGASTRAIELAQGLAPWHVAIACLKNSPVMKLAQERSIPVRTVGKQRTDPRIPFRLAKIIRSENFHIIDSQNIQSKFWSSVATLLTRVGFVSTLNSSYTNEHGGSLKGKLYQLIDAWTNWRTDRYVAVSETIRRDLLNTGIPNSAIDLIRNSVEIDETISPEGPAITRLRLGIPQDAILCILVGRLVWAKGYDDFVKAFSVVVEKIPNVYAVIAGDGELFAEISSQIKQSGLEKRIILPGFCDKKTVFSLLNASNVYVMSSRSEGIPFALLEAAALGLPIVATNCGGIPEVVMNHEDGLLVPISDSQALASAIITLCSDQKLAEKFGRKIKEKIKRSFAPAVQIEMMRQVYKNVLSYKGLQRHATIVGE